MEIEITDKKNNPFLKRTEVQFIISHENQKTPNQVIIKNELANSLNTNKENIIIDHLRSNYGIQKTYGYAKIYSSRKEAETIEQKYILKRNKMVGKKAEKKEESTEETPTEGKSEKSKEKDTTEESSSQEKQEET